MRKPIAYVPVLLAATLAVSGSAAQAAEQAPPKSYMVYSCTLPSGAPAGLGGWQFVPGRTRPQSPELHHFGDQCAAPPDNTTRPRIIGHIDGSPGVDGQSGLIFTAPEGTTISTGNIVWGGHLFAQATEPGGGVVYATVGGWKAGEQPSEIPDISRRVAVVGPNESRHVSWGDWHPYALKFTTDRAPAGEPLPSNLAGVSIGAGCVGLAFTHCTVRVSIHRVELTMLDGHAPTGTITGLPEQGASVSGGLTVHADAADRGSGVRELQVRRGAQIVARSTADVLANTLAPKLTASCRGVGERQYVTPAPCPLNARLSASIDTTTLPEGSADLRAVAIDAAGNETVLGEAVVTVDNLDPYNEDLRAAGADIQCGVDATGRWFNPGYAANGPANGQPATGAAALTGSFPVARMARKRGKRVRVTKHATTRTVNFASSPTIAGRLRAGDGTPVTGAKVYLAQRRGGGRWSLCDAPVGETSKTGSYRIKAPRRGVDRELVALYFPQGTTNAVVVGRSLRLRVRSGVRLTKPARSVRRGRTVAFRGRVAGEQVGALLVTLQVQMAGRGWRDFTTVRTRPDGTFSKRWRFRAGGLRYRIRAVVKRQAGRPYQLGYTTSYPLSVQ